MNVLARLLLQRRSRPESPRRPFTRRAPKALGMFVLVASLALTLGTPAAEARDIGYEGTVHRGINNVRLPDASFGACVDRQAERWARHLARTQYFHHSDIRATLRQCNARWVGEIIAWGFWTPHGVIRAWLHSPTHRRVMLNHVYRRMGVASVPYGRHGERATVVQFIAH